MKILTKQKSQTDNVTKYILEDPEFGLNEVSYLCKETKDVIVLPSQTNCKIGCKFCHLTGTTRPVKNLTTEWFISAVNMIKKEENLNRTLLISFMGAGEPLNNIDEIWSFIVNTHKTFGATQDIRFAISSVFPNEYGFRKLFAVCKYQKDISVKVHLSVHGTFNRDKLIKFPVFIYTAIGYLKRYNEETGNPIEYHYTLVNGINDSEEELTDFNKCIQSSKLDNTTVKFLTLSEQGGCKKSSMTEEKIGEIFHGCVVEFYDPPGRDVGSSCGMFDRSIYMKE